MTHEQLIARINELAHKANTVGLTDEEIDERNVLRRQYIEAFKTSLRAQLDAIELVDDDPKDKKPRKPLH
ncbi:DUF896 domain-containing protein [Paenibacillus koleovorans]|uniref:DUF896 domain-containing protein n=1 Tax=Paenibacillus koleovorans TaxID=121608 RepID=UPI000FDBCE24|nr:DUF896 domain-containing protein [Paenibacillus koleovorans]